MRTVNVILIKLITVVKVYLTTVTKIQFGREKKKLAGKRWPESKQQQQQQQIIMFNFP